MARTKQGKLVQLAELIDASGMTASATHHSLRMVRKARQVAARQEMAAKVIELKRINADLMSKLHEWESWYWYGDGNSTVGYEVASRLTVIAPVIEEKVVAAASGRAAVIPGNMRLRRNVAEHIFDTSIDIVTANTTELKRTQRGRRRTTSNTAFDVWALLENMATTGSSVGVSVCQLVISDTCSGSADDDGDSILNQLVAMREAAAATVKNVIDICADDSWRLTSGGVVYVGNDPRPMRVLRVGYGTYKK